MLLQSFCETHREDHFGICTTLKISTENYFEEDVTQHSGIELSYVEGPSHYYRKIRGKSWHLIPGWLMAINGLEPHLEECTKTPTVPEIRTIIIGSKFLNDIFADIDLDSQEWVFDQLMIPLNPTVKFLLDMIFLAKSTSSISRITYDCLISELVIELALSVRNSDSEKINSMYRTGHFPDQFIKAKHVIREGVLAGQVLNLDGISRDTGLSKFHFIREFKKHVGISPLKYVNSLRVDFAKYRLIKDETSIIDIAVDMGYNDLSTFNKSFKKFVGLSPSQFRQSAEASSVSYKSLFKTE